MRLLPAPAFIHLIVAHVLLVVGGGSSSADDHAGANVAASGDDLRRLGDTVAAGWQWPDSALLSVGGSEPAFKTIVVRAGEGYTSLRIGASAEQCTTVTSASQANVAAAHAHATSAFEAALRVENLAEARFFLSSALGDPGYELVLNSSGVHAGRSHTRHWVSSGWGGGGVSQDLRVAFEFFQGRGHIRVGTHVNSELLRMKDGDPPAAMKALIVLWVTGVDGATSVRVCPVSADNAGSGAINATTHPAPMIKLVRKAATRWDCETTSLDVPVLGTGVGNVPLWPLRLTPTAGSLEYAGDPFSFMQGGSFQLCYKPDATAICTCSGGFTCTCSGGDGQTCSISSRPEGTCNTFVTSAPRNHLAPASLLVLGVYSPCNVLGCLDAEPWHCHFEPFTLLPAACRFDLSSKTGRPGWGLTAGASSRIAWTPAWQPDDHSQGAFQSSYPESCAVGASWPSTGGRFDTAYGTGFGASGELLAESHGIVSVPPVEAGVYTPFTVSVCYCPDKASNEGLGACKSWSDYVQPVGRLYMWVLELCDYDTYTACATPYVHVVPQQRFVAKVRCPAGGACSQNNRNRLKVVDDRGPAKPTWDPAHLCQRISKESASAIWPFEADTLSVSGGARVDYKAWAEKQLFIDGTLGQRFTVCYCDGACSQRANWFQVGFVRTPQAFSLAAYSGSVSPRLRTVEYVNTPGSITLFGGITTPRGHTLPSPHDANMFSGMALLKVLSFDRSASVDTMSIEDQYAFRERGFVELQKVMDSECSLHEYPPTLVEGLTSEIEAWERRAHVVASPDGQNSRYMAFSGPQDGAITVRRAGTIAICYCARLAGTICLTKESWLFAGLVQVRGPKEGQVWSLPTRTAVGIENLQGWGFEPTDRLRIVGRDQPCAAGDDGSPPAASRAVHVGCPKGSATSPTCRQAGTDEELKIVLASSVTSGVVIQAIELDGQRSSILEFSGDIAAHLSVGDTITINPGSILVDGRSLSGMTDAQRFDAFTLAGLRDYQDVKTQSFIERWHTVSSMGAHEDGSSVGRGTIRTKLRIPIGWDKDRTGGLPEFTFDTSVGGVATPQWVRRNSMATEAELKAPSSIANLGVCWVASPQDGGADVYARAGELSFVDVISMPEASVSLTTTQSGVVAPIVISFAVERSRLSYGRAASGEMVLTLLLRNSDKVALASTRLDLLATGAFLPATAMSQIACGDLFMELWSNDLRGFPIPKGCYYGAVGDTGDPNEREVVIVFDRFNGLRNVCETKISLCVYQLVMAARVASVDASVPSEAWQFDLTTGCRFEGGGCRSKFELYERGSASFAVGTVAGAAPGIGTRLRHVDGFEILGGTVLDLGNASDIGLAVRTERHRGITQGSLLRVYLWPLLQWDLAAATADLEKLCDAICETPSPEACGLVPCDAENVGGLVDFGVGLRRNALKLVLPEPQDMFEGNRTIMLHVSGFAPPATAIFPSKWAAQISNATDGEPHYALSHGRISHLSGAEAAAVDARLLLTGPGGSGSAPFAGDSNVLYVRLRFLATLWGGASMAGPGRGGGLPDPAAFVSLRLPAGYTCFVPQGGGAPHSFDPPGAQPLDFALKRDASAPYEGTPESLFLLDRNADGHADFPRGTLFTDISWGLSKGDQCIYSLSRGQAVFAGQVAFVRLAVQNPARAMTSSHAGNVWSVRLSRLRNVGDGGDQDAVTRWDEFMARVPGGVVPVSERELWARSVNVLAKLRLAVVQPSVFGASAVGSVLVYLRPVQTAGRGGEIVVDAPVGFSFGEACVAQVLSDAHYSADEAPGHTIAPPDLGECLGAPGPGAKGHGTSRASVRVGGRLLADHVYAFKLRIQNPVALETAEGGSWHVYTAKADGSWLDGSPYPVPPTVDGHVGSWRLYEQTWAKTPDVRTMGVALRPYEVFRGAETLVIEGLAVASTGVVMTSLLVTLPLCCHFEHPAGNSGVASATLRISTGQGSGIEGEEELRTPILLSDGRQLSWPELSLRGGASYEVQAHFRASMLEDWQQSPHTFLLELGYAASSPGGRIGALAVDAPPLRAVLRASMWYLSSLAGCQDNVLTFRFSLSTSLAAAGTSTKSALMMTGPTAAAGRVSSLIFRGSEDLQGSRLACRPSILHEDGAQPLPASLACDTGHDALGAPFLRLQPGGGVALLAGFYVLQVRFSNPIGPIGATATWTIATYAVSSHGVSRARALQAAVDLAPLDAPASTAGFELRGRMRHAALLGTASAQETENELPERRPGLLSRVRFEVCPELQVGLLRLEADKPLHLRAPLGFKFPENCTAVALNATDKGPIELPYSSADAAELSAWQSGSAILVCEGRGNEAKVTAPDGLRRGRMYELAVTVRNPLRAPAQNFWTFEYGPDASRLVAGTPLAAIIFHAPPEPVDISLGLDAMAAVALPVTLRFAVQQSIPSDGELRLWAPVGFQLLSATVLARSADAIDAQTSTPSWTRHGGYLAVSAAAVADGIRAHVAHLLQVLVLNPAAQGGDPGAWRLASFDASGVPLDEGVEPGYRLIPPAYLLVTNEGDRRRSLEPVSIRVDFRPSQNVHDNDLVVFRIPSGYDLLESELNGETTQAGLELTCPGFAWKTWSYNATRPVATCACPLGPCSIRLAFIVDWSESRALGGVLYPAGALLSFQIELTNPIRNQPLAEAYWRVEHRLSDGRLAASAARRTWRVQPQLRNASVALVGGSRAAGAEASLLLEVTPASAADALRLTAEYPREVSFDAAVVEAPKQKGTATSGHILVVSRLGLLAGVKASVLVSGVRLGRGGGISVFSLTTFVDETFSRTVDELLHFEAFRQPGRTVVVDSALRSAYSLEPTLYPARSGLEARAFELAQVTFSTSFSYNVWPRDRLLVACEGGGAFGLLPDREMSVAAVGEVTRAIILGPSGAASVAGVAAESGRSIIVSLLGFDLASADVHTPLLEPGQLAMIKFWVLPTLGINNWRIETYHGNWELTNTNDGGSAGFKPVAALDILVQSEWAPPRTAVEVKLKASLQEIAASAPVPELRVLAPPQFAFPDPCGPLCSARGGTVDATGRMVATLSSITSATLLDVELRLTVLTPVRTPQSVEWAVVARGLSGQAVAWGVVDGFKINQMREAQVLYGAVEGLKNARVVVSFELTFVPTERRISVIEVVASKGFVFSCFGDDLMPMSLPGGKPSCERAGPGELRVSLGGETATLSASAFAFGCKAELPERTPKVEENTFGVIVREHATNTVADAAFDLAGQMLSSLRLQQATLAWTAPVRNKVMATVGFAVDNSSAGEVLALLISLPPGFAQLVREPKDIKVSNDRLPLRRGGRDWVDHSSLRRLRLLLEPSAPAIDPGSYRISFPVGLPEMTEEISPLNVWYLDLCSNTACRLPGDSSVIVSFPIVGFLPGELSMLEQARAETASLLAGTEDEDDESRSTRAGSWLSHALALLGLVWFKLYLPG